MAQVLPQSHGNHLLNEHCDGDNMLDPPSPPPFHFPAQQEYPTSEQTSEGPHVQDILSPSSSAPSGVKPSHDAARHTRKHMSLALPAFSFNPGGLDSDSDLKTPSAPHTPQSPTQSSPSRRHRRIQSEFIGGGDSIRSPVSKESSPIHNDFVFRDRVSDPPVSKPPSRGHRHRRSAALSQDMSAAVGSSGLGELTGVDVAMSTPTSISPPPTSATLSSRPGTDYLRSLNESPAASKSSSPVRVSFADNIEVIPRRSLPSLRSLPPATNIRAIHSSDGAHNLSSSNLLTSAVHPPAGDHWFSGIPDEASNEDLRESVDITGPSQISQGHDAVEDPLTEGEGGVPLDPFAFLSDPDPETSVFGEPGDALLSEEFNPGSSPLVVATEHAHFAGSDLVPDVPAPTSLQDSADSIVDLDSALDVSQDSGPVLSNQELRVLRAKSFSAARHSMHSSGLPAAAASTFHRRTESAPSLPMPNFDRPAVQRFNSSTASEKGFQMESVFEDEEGEEEAEKADDPPAKEFPFAEVDARPQTRDSETPEGSPAKAAGSAVKANKWLTETALRDSVSTITPELLASAMLQRSGEEQDEPYSLMSSPPVTPGTPSGVWASSICEEWPVESSSAIYSEASSFVDGHQLGPPKSHTESGRLSSEGVPSLISSRSTATSGAHRHCSSTASPHLDSPTLGGPPSSSGSGSGRWRKRSSIASLSRLMTVSGSNRSHLSAEYTPRCQTSDGLKAESKERPGKRKRLGRLLHLFRPKDARDHAPG